MTTVIILNIGIKVWTCKISFHKVTASWGPCRNLSRGQPLGCVCVCVFVCVCVCVFLCVCNYLRSLTQPDITRQIIFKLKARD